MQTVTNYLFALVFGITAGYLLARMQDRARHRRIWRKIEKELKNDYAAT